MAEDPDGSLPQRVDSAQAAKGRICVEPVDDVSTTEHDERLQWRQRSEVRAATLVSLTCSDSYLINVNLLWLKVGIQLLQRGPATARGRIPVEEWESHSGLQVPGGFGLVLLCFLSNDKTVDGSSNIFSEGRLLFAPPTKQKSNCCLLRLKYVAGCRNFFSLRLLKKLSVLSLEVSLVIAATVCWQVVVVLRTSLFFSLFPRVVIATSFCWSSCSEAAVRRLNTSVPTGGSRDATLVFCSAARTPSSPCSRFLAAELIGFFFLLF